jgi:tight adherence protein C
MADHLLAAVDFVALIPFAAFGACAIIGWLVVDFFMSRNSKSESRLERLKARGPAVRDDALLAREGFAKLLEEEKSTFADALGPKNEKEVKKIRKKLDEAGFRSESAIATLNTVKLISALSLFALTGGVSVILKGFNVWTLVYPLVAGGAGLFLPEFAVGVIASGRRQKIFLGLPDALDLMVVCVEAGLGMDQALRRVSEELEKTSPEVCFEFKVCNHQLQMGQTREAVLTDLGERNGVEDLKTLASVMIQVDRFGTSVGKALRVQSEAMRTRRRQIAEEKASKTAVKLIFPLVLFIFPGIFVVLVGPAAITMINTMLPLMTGGK